MEDQQAVAAVVELWRIMSPLHKDERDAMLVRMKAMVDDDIIREFINQLQDAFALMLGDIITGSSSTASSRPSSGSTATPSSSSDDEPSAMELARRRNVARLRRRERSSDSEDESGSED